LKKVTDSQRKFGSDNTGNPNYGQEAIKFFSLKSQSLTRSWPLDCFEQGIKWDAPLGLDFGLGFWRLHTMAVQVERPWEFMAKGFGLWTWALEHQLLYFNSYFQPISLDSQQKVWPLNPMAS
jgi:hypothetical protein